VIADKLGLLHEVKIGLDVEIDVTATLGVVGPGAERPNVCICAKGLVHGANQEVGSFPGQGS